MWVYGNNSLNIKNAHVIKGKMQVLLKTYFNFKIITWLKFDKIMYNIFLQETIIQSY